MPLDYSSHKANGLVEFIHKAESIFKAEKALYSMDRTRCSLPSNTLRAMLLHAGSNTARSTQRPCGLT
jgi:hypothetical protein